MHVHYYKSCIVSFNIIFCVFLSCSLTFCVHIITVKNFLLCFVTSFLLKYITRKVKQRERVIFNWNIKSFQKYCKTMGYCNNLKNCKMSRHTNKNDRVRFPKVSMLKTKRHILSTWRDNSNLHAIKKSYVRNFCEAMLKRKTFPSHSEMRLIMKTETYRLKRESWNLCFPKLLQELFSLMPLNDFLLRVA